VRIVHNDMKKESYFPTLRDRVKEFNSFISDISKNTNKLLIFTVSYRMVDSRTGNLIGNKLEEIIKYLKSKNCLDRVIFVGATQQKSLKNIN
jgi:hypothetical protein